MIAKMNTKMTTKIKVKVKSKSSLKSTIIVWFFLVSVVPLTFFLGLTLVTFQDSLQREILKRLESRKEEIQNFLTEQSSKNRAALQSTFQKMQAEPSFFANPRLVIDQLIKADVSHQTSLFSPQGKLLVQGLKSSNANQKNKLLEPDADIFLKPELILQASRSNELLMTESSPQKDISLVQVTALKSPQGILMGFVEQIIFLNSDLLGDLKNRTKLDFLILSNEGSLIASTQKDFFDFPEKNIKNLVDLKSNAFTEFKLQSNEYFLLIQPLAWGQTHFYIGLMISKAPVQETLKKINTLFITFVILLMLILLLLVTLLSHYVVKPLQDLLRKTQEIAHADFFSEIPVKSDHEIGRLTESFNQMGERVVASRNELKSKIRELESAQAQLVHNSKMASLGQLVAGVAHELNNPIGYIYSNMDQLKKYLDQLIQFSYQAADQPGQMGDLWKKYDIDFLAHDIPKLIQSCSEGALRTKDIVQGLKNFSRMEEGQEKTFSLHESIDNSLELLQYEIKDRIQIHKTYGDIPLFFGRPSEINQVFMNILTNAVQAIQGQGEIWISSFFSKDQQGEKISISIQDSGPGISNSIKEKIFDPFFSTKEIGKGTGLGLSISYGIVVRHQGEIQVHDRSAGPGSNFVVTLPVLKETRPNASVQTSF